MGSQLVQRRFQKEFVKRGKLVCFQRELKVGLALDTIIPGLHVRTKRVLSGYRVAVMQ
jgi:hypothetical protein